MVSCKSNDGALMRVSVISEGAGVARVSTFSSVANGMVVSAVQSDAAIMRVSAILAPIATGGLTAYTSLSVSSAVAIKGSAGVLYGYYISNTATHPNYVRFYNSTGATIGSTAAALTVMLPASAAANVEFPHGINFSTGISIGATSVNTADSTTAGATSCLIGNIFYN
jgi:hypothetical protein